jgi:ATP-binding cassette subfamily F protein 3
LEGLGFTSQQFAQNPSEFSGGYQVKLNLAKILLNEPDMLLLDEPTNYLDIYSIRWLGKFLKKWKGELVLITHDRAFMDSIINNTLIIHRNRFRKMSGNTRKMIEQIAKEEEVYESTRVREEKEREKTEAWIQRFGAKASMASRVKSREKMLDKQEVKVKLGDIKSLSFKFNYLPYTSKEFMVQLKNISFGYEPDKMLVKDLSFNIENGDKICIIGRNGNGKSTLLKLIHGEIQPQIGEITSYNKTAQGYFGQMNIEQLDPKLNIVEEIASVNSKLEETMVRRVCASMMFAGDTAFKKIGVLSGGEKSRVMLGKIVVTPVNLLLLDEPTNHFDMESSETLMEAIKNFEGAVIMVTHNEYFLHEVATKLIVFDGGKTFYFEGGYADFLKKIGWAE